MLILLPPSEGKSTPARGRPLALDRLSHPELTPARGTVLEALARASAQPDATDQLGLGASLHAEVAANTTLDRAPTAPARGVYTGVLYDAAGLADLSGTARRRANTSVRIISALWGVLAPEDRIPAYRLPMGARLQELGPLPRWWSGHLDRVLDTPQMGTDVVVDTRSSTYLAAWHPKDRPWVMVRVVADRNGQRTVVSHHAKHTRGLFTHHLLHRADPLPRTSAQVLTAAQQMVGTALLEATLTTATRGRGEVLELVIEG